MVAYATDTRGYLEVVNVHHENHFDTFTSIGATTLSSKVTVSSVTGSQICITDMSLYAATATTFTLFSDTTTTKFLVAVAAGASFTDHFYEPIVLDTSAALQVTTDGTAASLFFSGYTR